MRNSFYITTPIYYVNDVPHIGHTYTTVAADVMARYKRMCNIDTFFLTGTDEHGQKIEQAAQKAGLEPKQLADNVVKRYHELWSKLGVTNDDFIRTTDKRHISAVQYAFETLLLQGDIYEGEYEGWYCTPCEAFWTEGQLLEGDVCPDCKRPTSKMKEPTYFFRMSNYQERLLKHIEENPNFIRPESRKNEVVSFVKEGLRDLSVSRVTFSWGIPVTSDPKHVVYVWIDALLNYASALGYPNQTAPLYQKFWPASYHLVGKDIVRFHAVYWPTLLMALDLPLFETVYAHGWWTVEGQKMSKSMGNVVEPLELINTFGVDQVRYFLLREITFGMDGDFSYKSLISRINSDLANDFGNLVTRTFGMVQKYFDGVIPTPEGLSDRDLAIRAVAERSAAEYIHQMDNMGFNKALSAAWELVGALNKYIDDTQPWNLAKSDSTREELGTVLYIVCDSLRILSHFISPFMPESANKLRSQLRLSENIRLGSTGELGIPGILMSGVTLGEVTALFPRIDEKEMMAHLESKKNGVTAAQSVAQNTTIPTSAEIGVAEIGIDDFSKVHIIAGKVEAGEKVKKSEKLLKLSINDGNGVRTVVAGIAQSYAPEDLVGKTLAILGNLKATKLMGVESHGMVLAAFDGEKHHVMVLPNSVKPGTKIK